ncbi:MAG: hypothetical protein A2175_02310 [Candidatus Nealsonbacteria bacterium RBG_13_42_11]|uniref:Fibronectin type-III domain-containing protein n=1 Tax=Candidatus Nealsonbacteria bacterium RBG_13_42_11 TaxID=1801663 RepID=A0A1G2DZ35_9BACT|nr:MAG: hypothetical protein A2175_02310 [Candidatus Nealsonbacteria bacterium RBG_13_42_11]
MIKQNSIRVIWRKRKIKNKIPPVGLILILFLVLVGNAILFQDNQPQKVFAAGGDWYNSDWVYRNKITIDPAEVDMDLTNFAVLYSVTDADLRDTANGGYVSQSDGGDILFTNYTGTKLDHEIEKYVPATGELAAWVEVDSLSSTENTDIYIYYGNVAACADQWNISETWDEGVGNSIQMVQHLKDDPDASHITDSTSNNNDGTKKAANEPIEADGKIGKAQTFDGNDYISQPVVLGQQGSVEFWIDPDTSGSWNNHWFSSRDTSTPNNFFILQQYLTDCYFGWNVGGTDKRIIVPVAQIPAGWFHLVFTWDSATGLSIIYLNGSYKNQTTGLPSIYTMVYPPSMMAFNDMGSKGTNAKGNLDEFRIYNRVLSVEEISTKYNNTNDPSAFYDVAVIESGMHHLKITGNALQTAGAEQTITITAQDSGGTTFTAYSGDKFLVFSGANNAPDGTEPTCDSVVFGNSTTVNFVNGVGTCAMKLYKAETAEIDVDEGVFSSTGDASYDLDVTVSAAVLNNFLVEAPANANSDEAFPATITSRDDYNNITTDVTGAATVSVDTGSVLPASVAEGDFTDDGIWTDNITISDITEQPTVTLSVFNGGANGSDNVSVLGIPADPSGVSAVYNSDTQLTVTWSDNSTVESGYKIERNTDTGLGFGGYAEIADVGADTESFVDNVANNPADPPQADARYQYRARAYNGIGNSDYSEDAVIHYTTPGTPSNVAGAYVDDTQFNISYTDNAAVEDTHRIERCSGANCDATYETDLGTFESSPQSDTTGLVSDSRYRWRARAETPDSVYSSYGTSNYNYTTPDAPTIGTPAYVADDEITVNWTDTSAFEDGFRVWVSEDGGAFSEVTAGVNTVGAGIETYSYIGSSADHSYKFKVQSHTPNDLTNDSGESSVIYTTPDAPTIGTPAVDSATAITWYWTDNSDFEESFRLDFDLGGGTDVDDIAADSTNYQTTALDPNVQYAVHVHAYRADRGESPASASSNPIYTLANIPSGLTLVAGSQTQITVSWSANSNSLNTEYFVENITAGTNSGWITSLSWASAGLSCSNSYSFKVKARNGDNVETGFGTEAGISTQSCPTGSGMPSAWFNPPAPPAEGFNVLINNNNSETNSRFVTLALRGGSDAERMAISNFSDFKNAVQEPYVSAKEWDLCKELVSCTEGTYIVYAKFYTSWGTDSEVVSDSIIYKIVPSAEEPSFIERIPEILEPLIPGIFKPEPPEVEIPEIPIEELVPEETPLSLQNKWQLLSMKPIREFVLASLPTEIRKLAEKFPDLGETFKKVGITKITDVVKLKELKLTLPGLTESIGLPKIKIEPGKFALPQGVPIVELPSSIKEQLPTEIVFAKTGGELIDFNIGLTVDEKGELQQKITTISGKPLQLVTKPEKPVKSVKGYVVFKSKKPQETSFQIPFNYLAASLIFTNPVFAKTQENPVRTEEKLVLLEFEYTDPDGDGIYTAEIQAPIIEGEYEIITVMDFEDPELGKKEIRLITVIDPEGYIYEKDGNKETRIPGAIVSLFWLNSETDQYELWPAKEYQQENPQTTDVRGTYSFLVPEGYYYLKIETPGYLVYDGKPFEVKEGSGVHVNVGLKTKYWWLKIIDLKTGLLVLFMILLLYNFYCDKIREKTSKNQKTHE